MFTERSRLVIYLEHADVVRMTAAAKESGETLVEWARGALQNELHCAHTEVESPKPRKAEKTLVHPVDSFAAEIAKAIERGARTCEHGTAKGYHCWQCRGLAEVK